MNQDIQTITQLVDATLDLLADKNVKDLNADSPQLQKWKQVCTRTVGDMGQSPGLQRLREALHLDKEALAVVCLLALPEVNSVYADVFGQLLPSGSKAPDLDLLSSMVCTSYDAKSDLLQTLDSRSPLFFWQYLAAEEKGPLANRSLSLDPTLKACIAGTLDEAPGNLLSYWPGSPLHLKADADIHANPTPLQIIRGGDSPERRLTVAIHLAQRTFKMPLYSVNTGLLDLQGVDALRQLFAFATLKKAAVYWPEGVNDLNTHAQYVPLVAAWLKIPGSILFAGEETSTHFPEGLDPFSASTIHLSPLDDADKTQMWKSMSHAFIGSNAVQWEQFSQRYNPNNVKRIGETLMKHKHGKQAEGQYSAASIMESFLKTSPASIAGGMAQLSPSEGSVSDMMLNHSVQNEFHALCNAFLNRAKLHGSPTPGIICILQGAPGTGKTTAAHALAADLKVPLYVVDCSKIRSASEGQLSTLFADGASNSAALLFDNADALFAAKSDVSGATHLLIAFLAGKVETYNGLVLFATSEPDKIPSALRRRARTITIPHLTPAQRISLMQKTATQNHAFFDEHVNLPKLLSAYKFTGRHIKRMVCNAILSARANTASSEKIRITNDHLKHALKYEFV